MSGAVAAANPMGSPPGEFYCPSCERGFPAPGTCPTDGSKLIRVGGMIDPFIGRDLDGKYTILEKLGQGGMGAVYRAEQVGLGREVAIKVVHALQISEPDLLKRFLREAKLASRLGHPHAVGVIDFGQTDDAVCYLAMELVTGRTLSEVFAAEGVFPPERLVRIATQICEALECAHRLQIVHRDLKPANAMLLDQERDFVKILDFGLAKSVAAADASVTYAGAPLGTPAYMAPELALSKPCDGRADLYSLGVMLYQLGSGRLPFVSASPHELIVMHANEPAPPMIGVPEALARVVDRLLQKDPADRYPSAAAVREALEQALFDGEPMSPARAEYARRSSTNLSAAARAVLSGSRSDTAVPDPANAGSAPASARSRSWLAPVIIGAIAIAALAGAAGYLLRASGAQGSAGSAAPSLPTTPRTPTTPTTRTTPPAQESPAPQEPAMSPPPQQAHEEEAPPSPPQREPGRGSATAAPRKPRLPAPARSRPKPARAGASPSSSGTLEPAAPKPPPAATTPSGDNLPF